MQAGGHGQLLGGGDQRLRTGDQHNALVIVLAAGGAGAGNDYGQAVVPPGLSNVVAIAAGNYHSLAFKPTGR